MRQNIKSLVTIFLLLACVVFSYSATQMYSFSCNTKIIRGPYVTYEYRTHNYQFTMEVISDNYGRKQESYRYNGPFILAYPQERYSLRIHNPMPVRVAVNLTIDGINSITGQPSYSPDQGRKWVLDPYSSATISGWQVDSYNSRRFYFTSKEDSYASWRSNQLGEDLTVKCGQIAAAFFFSRSEMEAYFERNPIYEGPIVYQEGYHKHKSDRFGASPQAAPSAEYSRHLRKQAGTGMGERECNPVYTVNFRYDTGMYSTSQMVRIFYDFRSGHRHYDYPRPPYDPYNPYPQDDHFAPQKR